MVLAERTTTDEQGFATRDSTVSDGTGIARLTGLLPGRYALRVTRSFTAEDYARGGDALSRFDGLTGVGSVEIGAPGGDSIVVVLAPLRGGTLLFSEIHPSWPVDRAGNQYYDGGYLEIYNNSDTTIALAGKLFIDAFGGYIRSPIVPDGCSYYAPIERDPLGLWTRWAFRFPQQAESLPPGGSALIATDAIDHRTIAGSRARDLSRADFEFLGSADVDNPHVPNMVPVTPNSYTGEHGWRFRGGRQVWALADEVDIPTLPTWTERPSFGIALRIPASALLDVIRYNWDVPPFDLTIVDCPSPVLPSLDAADAVLLTIEDTLSIHRRVSRTLPDGRVLFQRSRNSAADWIGGVRTPGVIP